MTKLTFLSPYLYQVKRGQTLLQIAEALGVPAFVLARANSLQGEVKAGDILFNPYQGCVLHTVLVGESVCEIAARYETDAAALLRDNYCAAIYPTQVLAVKKSAEGNKKP